MNFGIIGTGSMGRNHMRVIDSIPEINLTSAMDINSRNLKEASDGFKINLFDDFRKMVDEVDAVAVSTPTTHHYEVAKFFLLNGKHVMVEKPFTTTLEQAEELISIAEKNNLKIGVGHLERFNPAVEFVNKYISSPLFIEIQRLGSFSPRSLDIDVVMDLMIHDLDIILNWDRTGIKKIDVSGIPVISKKVDIANARLEFNSGMVAIVTASRVSQKKTRKLRIFQKNGYFSVDYKKKRVKVYELKDGMVKENIPEIEDVEPLKNLWNNFYLTAKTGVNHNVTGQEGRDALALALDVSSNVKNIEI
jgi:predicted dehydrogenase